MNFLFAFFSPLFINTHTQYYFTIMEAIYNGRAIFEDTFQGIEITIPAKRNLFIMLFLSFWLCGWAVGELFALGSVMGDEMGGAGIFILFWLILWSLGGIMVISTLRWYLIGKEVITLGNGEISIEKKGNMFSKKKTYDLHQAKNFRVQEDINPNADFKGRGNHITAYANTGAIRFDYGMKTIKFGMEIDEAEANFMLQRLKNAGILTANHFAAI
jgi:hypothetical protein